jgi:L-glyceraldehyde reductase
MGAKADCYIDKPRWNINLFNTEEEKAAAHTAVIKL